MSFTYTSASTLRNFSSGSIFSAIAISAADKVTMHREINFPICSLINVFNRRRSTIIAELSGAVKHPLKWLVYARHGRKLMG